MEGMTGRFGRMITSACVVVYTFGTTITFLIVIGDQFDATFHSIYGDDFTKKVRSLAIYTLCNNRFCLSVPDYITHYL